MGTETKPRRNRGLKIPANHLKIIQQSRVGTSPQRTVDSFGVVLHVGELVAYSQYSNTDLNIAKLVEVRENGLLVLKPLSTGRVNALRGKKTSNMWGLSGASEVTIVTRKREQVIRLSDEHQEFKDYPVSWLEELHSV